jgi:hypothetical protein
MKATFFALLAAAVCLLGSSCMSLDMVAHAEGKAPPTDPQGPPYPPQPGYYALVPLVLPLDLVSLPVQYFYFRGKQDASNQQPSPPPPSGMGR